MSAIVERIVSMLTQATHRSVDSPNVRTQEALGQVLVVRSELGDGLQVCEIASCASASRARRARVRSWVCWCVSCERRAGAVVAARVDAPDVDVALRDARVRIRGEREEERLGVTHLIVARYETRAIGRYSDGANGNFFFRNLRRAKVVSVLVTRGYSITQVSEYPREKQQRKIEVWPQRVMAVSGSGFARSAF